MAPIAELATAQHGLVTAAQLAEMGIRSGTTSYHAQTGRMVRVHRGVYAVGHGALSLEARWLAAVLAAGHGAALSHLAAARLWCIARRGPERIDVVAHRLRRRELGTAAIHAARSLLERDVTRRNGIPVTTVARTLLDLGDVLDEYQLANVMHEAAYRRRLKLRALDDVARRNRGRAAVTVLRRALDLHRAGSAGTRSDLEDRYMALLRSAGVEPPRVNTRIVVGSGEGDRREIEVDFHWPDHRICVEVDGSGHTRARTAREDAERDALLHHAGYVVMRCGASGMRAHVRRVAALLAAYGASGSS